MSQGYDVPSHHAAVTIEADDDEDDLVAISGANASAISKGKGRGSAQQQDTLALPSDSGSRAASPAVSGIIGGGTARPLRTEIGGIKVETRYTGVNSLDESVGDSLVSATCACFEAYSGASG